MLVCLTFDPPGRTIEILSLVLYWLTLRGVYIYNTMKKWFSKGNIRDHDHKSSFGFEELKKKIIIDYPCLMMWMRIEKERKNSSFMSQKKIFTFFVSFEICTHHFMIFSFFLLYSPVFDTLKCHSRKCFYFCVQQNT